MVSVNGATSWGWVDEGGTPCLRSQAAFQLFRIRSTKTGDLLGLVAVPPDTGLGQIALIAQDLAENLEDPVDLTPGSDLVSTPVDPPDPKETP